MSVKGNVWDPLVQPGSVCRGTRTDNEFYAFAQKADGLRVRQSTLPEHEFNHEPLIMLQGQHSYRNLRCQPHNHAHISSLSKFAIKYCIDVWMALSPKV